MPRIARVVAPGFPHHVVQRGNRRQKTFFTEGDYRAYLTLMAEWCDIAKVHIWAYCLMPNHVHLVAVPETSHALRRGIAEAHRRYTLRVNRRQGWRGHLWQERFASYPMDEAYLLAATRYIELNPVRARLVTRPQDYAWSSANAHLRNRDDGLVKAKPLLEMVDDWQSFLKGCPSPEQQDALRRHQRTGRPLGRTSFVAALEKLLGRPLRPQKRGPKPKGAGYHPVASSARPKAR